MEEPILIKCEPDWPSDTEETSNAESDVELPFVNEEDMKVEPAPTGTEEGTTVFVKEECLIRDVKEEADQEDYDNDGQLPNQMQPLLHSTISTASEIQSFKPHTEELVSDTCNFDSSLRDDYSSDAVADDKVIWTCDYCSKSFQTQFLLQEHILLHGEDKLTSPSLNTVENSGTNHESSCDRCGKMFVLERFPESKSASLCSQCSSISSKHPNEIPECMKSMRKKRHICMYCNKELHFKSLVTHLRTHTGHKPLHCPLCEKAFADPSSLRRHKLRHIGVRNLNCAYCDKRFADKTNLRTHLNTHTGEKPYQCTSCGKSFSAKCSFRRHVKTHNDEKPFDCSICGKTFALKRYLDCHMIRHQEEKPFKCLTCGKSFALVSYLDKHMTSHTRVKSFKCRHCPSAFAEGSKLKTHLLTHTGEKPHCCPICKRCFSIRSSLNRHIKVHSGQQNTSLVMQATQI